MKEILIDWYRENKYAVVLPDIWQIHMDTMYLG